VPSSSPPRFRYKGDPPWDAPPAVEADTTVFHVDALPNAPPEVRHFSGTMNLGFAIAESKRNEMNVAILLQRFMAFAKQTDPDFRIEPLNGQGQCISNPRNIPISKDGMELYYQHRVVTDGIRGINNGAMSRAVGEMKDPGTPFRKYLNQEKVYASPAVLGLVDTRIIGVMLQTHPTLTFRDDIKAPIMDIMSDNRRLDISRSIFRAFFPRDSKKLLFYGASARPTRTFHDSVFFTDCEAPTRAHAV
jgi:hypothetical protein